MTVAQQLKRAQKLQHKVCLFLENVPFPYEDSIVKHIGRSDITFVVPLMTKDGNALCEYVISRKLVVGGGYVIASVDIPPMKNDDEGMSWFDII
ncbi:hypothetical protein [Scytonema sp. NUACC26]|uniref:hypothetical protein n=1 Tax=Scytonema sp. NUACC26 TaxID=3140176 RepID=UPI0034DC4DBF